MFVAIRELAHAKGRFALIAAVVALMMLLVGFVGGLVGGLGERNVSGVLGTGAERIVFGVEGQAAPSFAESQLDDAQLEAWRQAAAGAGAAIEPLGVSSARIERVGEPDPAAVASADGDLVDTLPVALFGAEPGGALAVPGPGGITLRPDAAAKLGVAVGDLVQLGGVELEVAAIADAGEHGHQPVAVLPLADLHRILDAIRQPHGAASVLLVRGGGLDAAAVDAGAGTLSQPVLQSLLAIESFKGEVGSLGMMLGMLIGAAVLVVGVFFLVWSMQRQREVAVLKALGAGDGWLRRDALGQSLLVLVVGVAAGSALTAGLGLAAESAGVPVLVSWLSVGLPAAAMLLAGLLGSLVSLRQVAAADPLAALAAA